MKASGKLITSYVANIKKIEQEPFFKSAIKLYISRGKALLISLQNKGFKQEMPLAPSFELLNDYKIYNNASKKIDWEEYVKIFTQQINTNNETKKSLEEIKNILNKGKDVILVCFEKDSAVCHRSIIRNYFSELGFDTEEYKI